MPKTKSKEIDEALKVLQEQKKKLQDEKKRDQEEKKRVREEKKLQKKNAELKKMDEKDRVDKQKERLIEAVKSRPCLWDKSTLEYRERFLKSKGWKEISKDLRLSAEKVKNMWDNLTDQVREIWRTERYYSGDGINDELEERKTWKFYKSLEFLRKVYKFRKTDSNFKSTDYLSESEDEDADVRSEETSEPSTFDDFLLDPMITTEANDDEGTTCDNTSETLSESVIENSEPFSVQGSSSQVSINRSSNNQGPSSQTKSTRSSTLTQNSKNLSTSQKPKDGTKRKRDEMEEKLISHLELTSKLFTEPEDPNEKFLSYLGETLQDVNPEKRRKCEKDVLKVVNAYAEECDVRIIITERTE